MRADPLGNVAKVNVYRSNGEWCYAAWLATGEFDCSDTLGVDDALTIAEVISEAQQMFPAANVTKVADISDGSRSDANLRDRLDAAKRQAAQDLAAWRYYRADLAAWRMLGGFLP